MYHVFSQVVYARLAFVAVRRTQTQRPVTCRDLQERVGCVYGGQGHRFSEGGRGRGAGRVCLSPLTLPVSPLERARLAASRVALFRNLVFSPPVSLGLVVED
jgi:hypothetical protein